MRARHRVVYLDHVTRLSGAEIALARLLEASRDVVEPHVILGEDGPLVQRLRDAGATVEVLPMAENVRDARKGDMTASRLPWRSAGELARYVWALRRRLRDLEPDLVQTNSLKAAIYGGLAGRLTGVPVVWHIHDRIATDYLPRSAVLVIRALSRVLPTRVVTNSVTTLSTLPLTGLSHLGALQRRGAGPTNRSRPDSHPRRRRAVHRRDDGPDRTVEGARGRAESLRCGVRRRGSAAAPYREPAVRRGGLRAGTALARRVPRHRRASGLARPSARTPRSCRVSPRQGSASWCRSRWPRRRNSRLDEVQAAVLNALLPRLDAWNERRRQIVLRYLCINIEVFETPVRWWVWVVRRDLRVARGTGTMILARGSRPRRGCTLPMQSTGNRRGRR